MNEQYDKLLNAIGSMPIVLTAIQQDRDTLLRFVDYMNQNAAEISKFGKATREVCDYLSKYDFTKKFRFDAMQTKLDSLHPLRLKLVKMGEEAKKLTVFPDRYDSKRAIEICRGLAATCMEKMSMDETGKVQALVETNTQKLIAIQNLFKREKAVLSEINAAIDSEKAVLNKVQAYTAELKQYVSDFPHQDANDDLAVVKNRITTAKEVVALWEKVDKEVEDVRDYADRFNKKALIDYYSQVAAGLSSKMCYSDVSNYKGQLNKVMQQIQSLRAAFEKENHELQDLQNTLMLRKPDTWKDDNEKLLSKVTALLNKHPEKTSYDLGQLKNEYVTAKQKRVDDVDAMLKKHRWLGSSMRYKSSHDALKTKYITYTEYQTSVEMIRKERRKRLLCIPVIGWIILIVSP